MGPRSENRGYVGLNRRCSVVTDRLQWVHGPKTVVMHLIGQKYTLSLNELQWVHGPRTVVMGPTAAGDPGQLHASMGPRSVNRGYAGAGVEPATSGGVLQWVHGPRTVVMWMTSLATS